MKININDKKTILITELKEKIIFDLINKNEFFDLICSEIEEIVVRIYKASLLSLKSTWNKRLLEREIHLPESDEDFVALVFSQPDYQDRLDREIEAQAHRTSGFKIE